MTRCISVLALSFVLVACDGSGDTQTATGNPSTLPGTTTPVVTPPVQPPPVVTPPVVPPVQPPPVVTPPVVPPVQPPPVVPPSNVPAPGALNNPDSSSHTILQDAIYLYLDARVGEVIGNLRLDPPVDGATWAIRQGNDHGIFDIDNFGRLSLLREPDLDAQMLQPSMEIGVEVRFGTDLVNGQISIKTAVHLSPVTMSMSQNAEFSLPANTALVIEAEQIDCPIGEVCCAMRVDANKDYLDFNGIVASAPDDRKLRIYYPPMPAEGMLVTSLRSVDGATCSVTLPDIVARATGDSTEEIISATGELGVHDEVSVSRINGRDYLFDVSRRGMDGLADDAVIFVQNNILHQPFEFATFHDAPVSAATNEQDKFLPAGVDAHKNTLIVFDYIRDLLGKKSYDDKGGSMIVLTTLSFVGGLTCSGGSCYGASWNGSFVNIRNTLGELRNRKSYSAALDVMAHEWGHALEQGLISSGGLNPSREPGALAESFSDWFGAAVEESYTGEVNWLIGEDADNVVRSMENPGVRGHPDTYRSGLWRYSSDHTNTPCNKLNDNCGIHSNSGVGNKMFYLLSAGGIHNGVTVTGIGSEKAIKIASYALENFWTSGTNYSFARTTMIRAAAAIHGVDSVEQTQVRLAWDAVRVSG